jgi:putative DNA modification/repair radical SAM protein
VSLLKILYSNRCAYDCAFCINRRSNDIPRATFTVEELVDLTLAFYRRNYIEGLFLSSGIWQSPDRTMECLVAVARALRRTHGFGGYIHLKAIPGASPDLIREAGVYADRLSVNIELPSEASLAHLAPQKRKQAILGPMQQIRSGIEESQSERRRSPRAPVFAPAGQSTQLIVGASPESDLQILRLSQWLYDHCALKRVYYSAYVPVNPDSRLPALREPPLLREHRLYQADWLVRLYGFRADELIHPDDPQLAPGLDPKTAWALRHPHLFPVEVNRAPYEMLLRVPGVGLQSARRICASRRFAALDCDALAKLGVVLKRARFFVTCNGRYAAAGQRITPERLRACLTTGSMLPAIGPWQPRLL